MTATATGFLELTGVSKRYNDTVVLKDLDISIGQGEFISLIGPSGSGKTTTLRIIAGLEMPTAGSIAVDGRDITALLPNERGFGMVFQHFALFPHLDVYQNVAYGLKVRGDSKPEIEREVLPMLDRIGLRPLANRKISELSGGQRQRVGIARALIVRPKLLLLDEPTGSLDTKLKLAMQTELKALHEESGLTFIHVTHNQSEALALANRVYVMNDGRIEQQGSPSQVYRYPATRFVADFVGRNNLIDGEIDGAVFRSPLGSFPVGGAGRALPRGACTAVIRADSVQVGPAPEGAAAIQAPLDALEYAGSMVTWFFGGGVMTDVSTDESAGLEPKIGKTYTVWWDPNNVHYLSADGTSSQGG
ncbi:MAG: ABC transporter ATP-binding protein [Thermomicrobiales bacterium]|nr:ABC transporter ATP-binding protein [Thermomicrobiales bacterium]